MNAKWRLFAVLTVLDVLSTGLVMMILWNWFVVPLGLRQISMAWAVGLYSLVSLFQNPALLIRSNDELAGLRRAIEYLLWSRSLAFAIGVLVRIVWWF